jgi:hypothetical protein
MNLNILSQTKDFFLSKYAGGSKKNSRDTFTPTLLVTFVAPLASNIIHEKKEDFLLFHFIGADDRGLHFAWIVSYNNRMANITQSHSKWMTIFSLLLFLSLIMLQTSSNCILYKNNFLP